jgi:hypothetical protein
MSRWFPGGRRLACCVTLISLAVEVYPAVAAPTGAPHEVSRLERVAGLGASPVRQLALDRQFAQASLFASDDFPAPVLLASGDEALPDSSDTRAGRRGVSRNAKIVGTTLFASGVFLCSWGITSWQRKEDQCCPTRNSENVIKITVGIVLIDAGMVYLLGGVD